MDDFCVDGTYFSDENVDEPCNTITNVAYTVSNKTYKIIFSDRTDIFDYAIKHPNCILTCDWRCTAHFKDFSVNMFKGKTWMLMTKELQHDKVASMVFERFGKYPIEVKVVNITILINLGFRINLEQIHADLGTSNMSDIFAGATNETIVLLDKQKFPALIAKPNKNSEIVLEIYSTGAINATGLKSNESIDDVMTYIKNRICPLI